MLMRFNLTEQHILKGKKGIRSCPIALSIKDILNEPKYSYVSIGKDNGSGLVKSSNGKLGNIDFILPGLVSQFIYIFDELILLKTPRDILINKILEKWNGGYITLPFHFEIDINYWFEEIK